MILSTRALLVLVILSVLAGTSLIAQEPVPVGAFSRLPALRDVALSPDGKHLAYILTGAGRSLLVTQSVASNEHTFLLESDNEERTVSWFGWANNDWLLVSVRFAASRYGVDTAESRLLRIKRDGGDPILFFRPGPKTRHQPQFQDNVISWLPDDPEHFLVALDDEKPNAPTVYRVDVASGAKRRILRARPPVRDWMVDQSGRIRIGFAYDDGESSVIARLDPDKPRWTELWRYRAFEEPPREVLGFGADPNTLYVRALHDGRKAIFSIDLSDAALPRTLLLADAKYDIEGRLIHSPKSGDVVGVYHRGGAGRRTYWDPVYQGLQDGVDQALPDTTNYLIGFSRDERRYVVYATSDVNPGVFYFGDRDKKVLSPFGERYPELSAHDLSGKEPVTYEARDGLVIEGYLTRPWGDASPPWPTVLLPHGGPMVRDDEQFDFQTEFLASRGYAVLQMNFRGSSGYGWDFESAAHQDMGGKMQDDVTDGAKWLVEQGYAEAGRMCIMGGSYGGYAALWATVKTPDLFRCAISVNGVSDWALVFAKSRYYVGGEARRQQLGERTDLMRVSPLRRAAEIRVPILLVHGEDDRVVPVKHSRKMAKALEEHGKTYRYIELEHGSHHLSNQHNRTLFLEAVESFLFEFLPLGEAHEPGAPPADGTEVPDRS